MPISVARVQRALADMDPDLTVGGLSRLVIAAVHPQGRPLMRRELAEYIERDAEERVLPRLTAVVLTSPPADGADDAVGPKRSILTVFAPHVSMNWRWGMGQDRHLEWMPNPSPPQWSRTRHDA
ncbi:MAG: hypothetical protein EOO71_04325 [Myxococcaceae bacterium]|nr:MAG: hypothetical protein EOO71_04325 [Myxococcaceae bacterium]